MIILRGFNSPFLVTRGYGDSGTPQPVSGLSGLGVMTIKDPAIQEEEDLLLLMLSAVIPTILKR